MKGLLHVLQHASPDAPRLHAQPIAFDEPPARAARFHVRTVGAFPVRFATDRIETEPLRVGELAVYFATRHTAYLLELTEVP